MVEFDKPTWEETEPTETEQQIKPVPITCTTEEAREIIRQVSQHGRGTQVQIVKENKKPSQNHENLKPVSKNLNSNQTTNILLIILILIVIALFIYMICVVNTVSTGINDFSKSVPFIK